ncbi:MAG: 2-C-methyl-D-erythritol 2,4-cyclodiphosphate synthase [Atribacterota bacterium]|jgi:2-C-methyl-D-erythritol 2,4-cyclodiphosphate synthase|nr:2-C-methyl-D-erythritol 2,4-cyclodiphosphate synthase [Atribacterota bacterium]MDD4895218.1 2-C-methyl-D-erythritol 2,4-cyclodiphosphate synthase [Atribacterota bacterium]MDD5636464.1 2-C-methyl-D-erythritol 2,4-cyclodiphosphate synthase [Atribacterota bacterium]
MRIGFGYDIHPLKKGKKLILGGVKIDSERGLEGYSDADVVIHAVIDALLGASGQGDIGLHFPTNEIKWKNISSMILLSNIYKLIKRKKYRINNIDITIVLEKPKLLNYYPDMKRNIAKILKINEDYINIKATTNEGMGIIGKGNGIAAFCVALLEKIVN